MLRHTLAALALTLATTMTLLAQVKPHAESVAETLRNAQRSNWLPAPKGEDFSLYIRSYWPQARITGGSWTPPPVKRNG